MSELPWREVPGGFDSGIYRLRHAPAAAGWQLEIRRRGSSGPRAPEVSFHRKLSGARAHAAVHETERVRRIRIQLHVAVAAVVAMAWVIQASVSESGPAGYLMWLLLLAVGLNELANAVTAASDDPSRTPRLARWISVDSLAPTLRYPPDGRSAEDDAKVRVLDPTL